jgi:hypothetical protein
MKGMRRPAFDARERRRMDMNRRRFLAATATVTGLALNAPSAMASRGQSIDITSAPLGQNEAVATRWLAVRRIKGGQEYGRYRIYETPVFERVFDRQQLVLALPNYALSTVIVIVTPAFQDDIQRMFSDVFDQLLGAYGRPSISRERGRFSRNIAIDLRTRAFRREHDWRLPQGRLRLGIPKRTDRLVRVEVHFARRLPLTTQSDWSIEAIR